MRISLGSILPSACEMTGLAATRRRSCLPRGLTYNSSTSMQLAFTGHSAGKLVAQHVLDRVQRTFPKLNDAIELNLTVKGGEPL